MQHLPARRTRAGLGVVGAVLCSTLAALSLVGPPTASAATPVIVGVVGDAPSLAASSGASVAVHGYGQLTGSVPTGTMINMHSGVTWRTVSAATPGSAVYNDILRWATTLKARSGSTMLAFHHEPEASGNVGLGTSSEYAAAYRKVVSIFRGAGVTNVEFTWQMTSYAFTVSASDARSAAKWYPGDDVVTYVAADPYNFYTCGPGQGVWRELSQVTGPALTFAKAHGKKLVLGEFASQYDTASPTRRTAWLTAATAWMVANRDSIKAVFYYNLAHRSTCLFPLRTSGEFAAYAAMVRALG